MSDLYRTPVVTGRRAMKPVSPDEWARRAEEERTWIAGMERARMIQDRVEREADLPPGYAFPDPGASVFWVLVAGVLAAGVFAGAVWYAVRLVRVVYGS